MKLVPLNGHYLVRPSKRDELTRGGVVLPQSTQDEDLDEGTIISRADDFDGIGQAPGDVIVYRKYGGCEVNQDGETLLLVPHKNVFAVRVPA